MQENNKENPLYTISKYQHQYKLVRSRQIMRNIMMGSLEQFSSIQGNQVRLQYLKINTMIKNFVQTVPPNTLNQHLGALNPSEEESPRNGKPFSAQNRNIFQTMISMVSIVSLTNLFSAPSTTNSSSPRESESRQEPPDSGGENPSQTQSYPLVSEIPTNVETAFLVGKVAEERPRSFSEPNPTSRFRLEDELETPVEHAQLANAEDTEDENRRHTDSRMAPSNQNSKQKRVQIWNVKTREEITKSYNIKWDKNQELEKIQIQLKPLGPEEINISKDKRLSEKLRFFQNSSGNNLHQELNFQNEPQTINTNERSRFEFLSQLLSFSQNKLTRLFNFQIGDIRIADLKNTYFMAKSSILQYRIRRDRAKRGIGSNSSNENQIQISQVIPKIDFTNLNIDMINIQNGKEHKRKKSYMKKTEEERLEIIKKDLINQIENEKPFIQIQEAYTKASRKMIRQVVQTTTTKKGYLYYYPQHLDEDCDKHATIILSKYKVRFGRIKFTKIKEMFAEQCFCEFEVFNFEKRQIETICLICCHWKSSAGENGEKLVEMRQYRSYQKDCCNELHKLRGYSRMLLIGDTNLEVNETLENDQQFTDTYFQSKQENVNFAPRNKRISKYQGTQLLMRNGQVNYVRPDRALVDKASQDRTRVKTKIRDLFLEGYESQKKNEKNILIADENLWQHIRPQDHHILDGSIYL